MSTTAEQTGANCFAERILRDFNSGRLRDVALETRVADHLVECESCESRLASFEEPDSIIRLLQQPDPLESLGISDWLVRDESLASTKTHLPSQTDTDAIALISPTSATTLPVRIDRYFVIRQLGSGGFAQVFLAKDPENNRLVAIKVPRPDRLATKSSRAAFLKEARIGAALDHSHIVPVYDCRELQDGRCIVVMKYIEGQTLSEAMQSERFDQKRVIKLVATIAEALQYAHERRLWHRDVKPANILLDEHDSPHLADFGLAIHEDQQHLHKDEFAGTHPYMSPEQIRGKAEHLDGRSDIWSLGVVLYELLTRKRPFRGNTIDQLSDEILHREPRPPTLVTTAVDARYEQICLRCLKKDPAQRFATAADVAAALRTESSNSPSMMRIVGIAVFLIAIAVFATRSTFDQPTESGIAPVAGEQLKRWHPFLNREPTPVIRNILNKFNLWQSTPEQERFDIRSGSDVGIASFGTIHESHFRLRVQLTVDQWTGYSGLVFGLHDLPDTRPGTRRRCYAVRIGRSGPADTVSVDVRQLDLISPSGLGARVSSDTLLANGQLDPPMLRTTELEIHVNSNRLEQVMVNGRSVKLDRTVALSLPTDQPTEIGVTTIGGLCVFERGSLLLLKKE